MDDSTEMGQTYAKQVSAKRKHDGDPMVDFPVYYPTRLAPGSFIAHDTPRVRDRRARRGRLPRLQDGRRRPRRHLRPRPARRVLRDLGHRLDRRADPRQPERDADDRRQATTCCSTTATGCAWSAGRPTRAPTGSTTRCCSRSTRARCSRSRPRCASSTTSSVSAPWKRARSRRSASSGSAGSASSPPPASPSSAIRVVAIDIDAGEDRGAALRRALPIHEPGLARAARAKPRAARPSRPRWTRSSTACRLLFCCVDTPPTYSGDADLSRVQAVVAALPDGGEHALVMKSTVPAGTGRGDPPRRSRTSPTSPVPSSSRRARRSRTSCIPTAS